MQLSMNPGKPGDRTSNAEQTNNSPEIPGAIRKMSRLERLFFMRPVYTIIMAARITGAVDPTRFRQAIDAASRIHPLLRAKIVFDERHEVWFSSEGVPPVPLRVIPRKSDHQWLDEMNEEVRVPFDIGREPLIRFVLLSSPEVSDLLILCNHSICDGMALANLIRDILSLYDDPAREVRVINPPDILDIVKPGITLQGLIARIFVGLANRKWRKNPYHFGVEEYSALYRGFWEKRTIGLVLLEFDPDESARLLATCRSHGITVGSAVSAACLAAHREITGGFSKRQQTVMVPFDLRKRLKPPMGNVFCFCDSGARFPFVYSPEKSFWDNAKDLHREIHARVEVLDPSCLDMPVFEPSFIDAITAFAPYVDKIPDAYSHTDTLQRFIRDTGNVAVSFNRTAEKDFPGFVPSNIGRIDMPEFPSGIRLDRLIFLPGICESGPLSIGGAGAGGRTVFSLPFVDSMANPEPSPGPDLIRIRNRALEYLGFPEKVRDRALE